jgi:hypothetical protein
MIAMNAVFLTLAVNACLFGTDPSTSTDCPCHSYLLVPTSDGVRAEPYCPREGDVLFFNDYKPMWVFLYRWAHSGPPYHAALVVRSPCGRFVTLESGPDDTQWAALKPLMPRLHNFCGTIHVRRIKQELTPCQSAELTRFAVAKDGHRYAFWRLLLQGTPLRSHGWNGGERFYARPVPDRRRYLCAEICFAALTHIGVLNPPYLPTNAIHPIDVFDNQKYDLGCVLDDAYEWSPEPFQRPPCCRDRNKR